MNASKHGITESSVLAILAEALGSFPQPSLPGGPLMSQAQSVSGQASLTGAWNGTVTLHVPVSLASSLTSALFATPASEISAADRVDVVAELCNVVAGNLKGLIQGEVILSLPIALEVNTGAADSQTPPGSGAIAVDAAFPFLGQPIAVRIIEYPAP